MCPPSPPGLHADVMLEYVKNTWKNCVNLWNNVWVKVLQGRLWDTALISVFNLRWCLLRDGIRVFSLSQTKQETSQIQLCLTLLHPLFYLNVKWPTESHTSLQCLEYLIKSVEFLWCVDGCNHKYSIFQSADFWFKMPLQPGFFTWTLRPIRFASKVLSTEQQPRLLAISFTGPTLLIFQALQICSI